jgi:hypothetical protein
MRRVLVDEVVACDAGECWSTRLVMVTKVGGFDSAPGEAWRRRK